MCGLFGTTYPGASTPELLARARAALHTLEHRGPDQWGDVDEGGVYVGHRRLSIIDTSELGAQPMVSRDGRFAIAVNGEIYNHRELRAEIGDHDFVSDSDSEVVLHGVRAWGIDGLLDRLDGMYALVVHDREQRKVHLARDRVGIKPLYYRLDSATCTWASELGAIRHFVGEAALPLDHTAIYDFLTHRYIPAPKSLYRNVHKVRPAELVTVEVDSGRASRRIYWEPLLDPVRAGAEPSLDLLRDTIDAAVDSHLMSDVPLGFFLSGGIDSSIVLCHAARHHPAPTAYTIGYDDPARDESVEASVVGERYASRHVVRHLSAGDAVDLPTMMAHWFDEPFADSSALSTWHVSQLARTESTVALSGDGGDELFGGYRWYARAMRLAPLQRRLLPVSRRVGPTSLVERLPGDLARRVGRNVDRVMRGDVIGMYAHLMGDHLGRRKQRWRHTLEIDDDYDDHWSFREHDRPDLPLPTRFQLLDFKTFLPDDVLTKVDRVSMAVSLEVRVPLLARSVVELAFGLPGTFHMAGGELKAGLKAAYRDVLPSGVVDRPKRGFSVPLESWRTEAIGEHASLAEAVLARFVDA